MSAANKIKDGPSAAKIRKSLSLAERINVIKQHEKTPSLRTLSTIFQCSLTQIKNILRRKSEYLEEYKSNGNLARIKRRQSARFLVVGVIVCEWLYRATRNGEEVDDDLILTIARKVVEKVNMTEVRPSNNWLYRMRQKFKISEQELDEMYYSRIGNDTKESLELDDIIQDLQAACPNPDNMLAISLAFPFELTKKYLKDTEDDAHDISKVRMKNCLEEAKGDKFMQVDNCDVVQDENQYGSSIKDEINFPELLITGDVVKIKSEAVMNFSSDSYHSGRTENSCIALLNDNQIISPAFPNVCIKQEVLTKGIRSYKEAYNILGPMEQFALAQEDIRAIGLINQLENHFRENMMRGKK